MGLAGLAQSNLVMFFLSMVGAGIPTAGMVYARDMKGWRRFARMNLFMGLAAACAQGALCLPPVAHFLFGKIIGLPPSIEGPAKEALWGTIPLQFLFFLRNPYQVALLLARESAKASAATIGRIVFTGLMTLSFTLAGWVGVTQAVVCLTLPVGLEVMGSMLLAAPYVRRMPQGEGQPPSMTQLIRFVLPLSAGGVILALSGPILGAFIARAGEAERSLPVYYLAMGLTSPMAFSASRIQSVVLAFPPVGQASKSLASFALRAGAVLGLIPLVFLLPPLAGAYFVSLQKLPQADLPLLRATSLALVAVPLCVAMRSHKEGVAAWLTRPFGVLAGQVSHVLSLVVVSALALVAGLPGHLLGPTGLVAGNLAAAGTISIWINRGAHGDHSREHSGAPRG